MLNRMIGWVFFLVLLINYHNIYALESKSEIDPKFITIADVHFDPFIGCKRKKPCELISKLKSSSYLEWEKIFEEFSDKKRVEYYQDTSYVLLKSSLQEIEKVSQETKPQFAVILGDFLAHNFREKYKAFSNQFSEQSYRDFVKKTMQFLTLEIEKTFPKTDVYPVIGNNDSYTGDYSVIPNGPFLQETMDIWSRLIKDKNNRENFRATFAHAGYYEITLPTESRDKIIVLNTVLFSDRVRKQNVKQSALEQLNWLHQKLVSAKQQHQHAMLAFHIPVGIDVFATIKNKFDIKEFWQESYTEQFELELLQFADTITAILPAHIHMDTFQLITLKQLANIPIHFTPSISPIFGNNPGFKVFSFNPNSFHINHTDTHFYQLNTDSPAWKLEYSFNNGYRCESDAISKEIPLCVYPS